MTYVSTGPKLPFRPLPLGLGATGLDGTYYLSLLGQNVEINIPFEEVAKQAAAVAINAAMPPLKAALPGMIASAVPALKKEMPGLISAAVPELNKHLPVILKAAEAPLEAYINNRLWPKVIQPILEGEIRTGTTTIGAKAQKAGLIAGGTILVGVVTYLLLSGERVQVSK